MTDELLRSIRNLLWLILGTLLLLVACVALRMDRDLRDFVGVLALLSGLLVLGCRLVFVLGGGFLKWVKRMDEQASPDRGASVDPEKF